MTEDKFVQPQAGIIVYDKDGNVVFDGRQNFGGGTMADMKIDELINEYCTRLGISRQQYEAEGLLRQKHIGALVELHQSKDPDPLVPRALPGGGKRRSELTDLETEELSTLELEFDDLLNTGGQ
jgi:hypothetical protein